MSECQDAFEITVEHIGGEYKCQLKIGNQYFVVGDTETVEDAEFTRNMLNKAMSTITKARQKEIDQLVAANSELIDALSMYLATEISEGSARSILKRYREARDAN